MWFISPEQVPFPHLPLLSPIHMPSITHDTPVSCRLAHEALEEVAERHEENA